MGKARTETQGESGPLHDSDLTRFFDFDLDLLCIADTDGYFRRVNRAWEKTLGYAPEELEGSLFLGLVHPDDMESTLAAVADLAVGKDVRGFVNRYRHRDGSYRWIEWRSAPYEDTLIYAAARDITERTLAEQALRAAEERYRTLFDQIPDGVIVLDRDLRVLDCNQRMLAMTGLRREDLIGRLPEERDTLQETHEALAQALRGEVAGCEATYRAKDSGRPLHLSGIAAPLRGADSEIIGVISVVSDLTERKLADELIERLAFRDPLTDLPNGVLLRDRLRQAIDNAERAKQKVAVAVLNLDRFKNVTDTLGHDGGERTLQTIAGRLSDIVRKGDTLARTGGDEFALLMPSVRRARDTLAVSEKMLVACRQPWQIDGQSFYATASVGFALYPDDASDASTLLERADTAMREAKAQGGDACRFYDLTMNLQAAERLTMEHDLHKALEEEQFVVYYQPQVDLRSGEIIGAEALVRWQHPERGLVPPLEFIPLAEETGLIAPLGEWVVRTACLHAVSCQRRTGRRLRLAVNISTRRLHSGALAPAILAALQESGLPPEQLEVELTETAIMVDPQAASTTLGTLREQGITVALDDFGTGFSSLTHLYSLPIDRVKIDRSFVSRVTEDQDAAAIVRALTDLCHSLGLGVLAEGVETEAELEFLQHLGCEEAQGYLFARPLPAAEYETLLTAGRLAIVPPRRPS